MHPFNRIGLYGGTFDPLHNAHLQLADWVVKTLQLRELYFIPSARHPFKLNSEITPPEIRYKMLSRVFSGSKIFKVSRIEVEKPGISYTIDTIRSFRESPEFHDADLFLIIGADNLKEFHLWKDPEEIFQLAKVIVLKRPGEDASQIDPRLREKMVLLNSPEINMSATMIRKRIKNGKSVEHLIPQPVWTIIQNYHLYGFKKSGNEDY